MGDDWAEDHHDIEVMDEAGQVLATRWLPEGVAGIGQLQEHRGRGWILEAESSPSATFSSDVR